MLDLRQIENGKSLSAGEKGTSFLLLTEENHQKQPHNIQDGLDLPRCLGVNRIK